MNDMRAMGATPEMIEAWRKERMAPEQELLLQRDVYPSIRVFDAMATQWDRAGDRGARAGLMFDRALVFMDMLGIRRRRRQRRVFHDLRILELETLNVQAEQHKAEA